MNRQAGLIAVRAGEGALAVAEELILQQVMRNRGTVDGQEPRRAAGALNVNGPRDQFLAGAAFADKKHGRGRRRHLAHHLKDALHGWAAADDMVEVVVAIELAAQGLVFLK